MSGIEYSEWVQEAEEEETMKMRPLLILFLFAFLILFTSPFLSWLMLFASNLILAKVDCRFNDSGQETHNNARNPESDLRKTEDVITSTLAKGYILGKRHRSEQKLLMRSTSLVTKRQQKLFLWTRKLV
ncbi:hypothetical protein Fmac_011698 [Flemingia macrophylla]|uniref:Uncharacterized protein n=1 Tax=Flemingia macrophylla TaxID=520843 RepID=A0ABD1MN80_9FABA